LVVAMDAEIKLFDGQHRSYGTYLALNRILSNPQKYSKIDLSSISVPLMAYTNLTLVERQMFFSDINMNMSKPQAAIGIAYDHRDPLARFAVEIAQELPFAGLVELEKNTVSKKSDKLFSMKTIYDVVKS
ncbi:DGQHR domain-containing protein, partial [Vibrio anguillarum]|nr:DGQHR domain-containing protein [Vibrio anguillarum]